MSLASPNTSVYSWSLCQDNAVIGTKTFSQPPAKTCSNAYAHTITYILNMMTSESPDTHCLAHFHKPNTIHVCQVKSVCALSQCL